MAELLETNHMLPFDALTADIKIAVLRFQRRTAGRVVNVSVRWEDYDINGSTIIKDVFIEAQND